MIPPLGLCKVVRRIALHSFWPSSVKNNLYRLTRHFTLDCIRIATVVGILIHSAAGRLHVQS